MTPEHKKNLTHITPTIVFNLWRKHRKQPFLMMLNWKFAALLSKNIYIRSDVTLRFSTDVT